MTADDIRLDPVLTRATAVDADLVGAITAEAFRTDPFNIWLFRSFPGIEALFRYQAKRIYVPRGFSYRLGNKGACMWMLPGASAQFGFADYLRVGWSTLVRSGAGAVRRAIRTGGAMDARHPTFPHAYLFSIAVHPDHQGKGLGRTLIRPVLDACDNLGLPAYLENSNPANTGFYRSCGFEQSGEPIHPEPGSPPLVPMLRQPR